VIDFRSLYHLLQVPDDSSDDEIKSAFRRLSKAEHPDKHGNSPESNARFRLLLNAYTVLADPEQRKEYDTYLKVRARTYAPGKVLQKRKKGGTESPAMMTSHLNFLLWDIEDFLLDKNDDDLNQTIGNHTVRYYLLLILTFIDKWVLETAGYPDYFMEARQLKKIDPREYVTILGSGRGTGAHISYTGVVDYFYDIRKRMDRFLAGIKARDLFEKNAGGELRLADCIIEAQNLAVHYLSYLLHPESGSMEEIPPFLYSCQSFLS